jgi:geranylgeranyl diphosphate synthase type II
MNAFDTNNLGAEFAAYLPLPATLDPHFEEALRHVLDNPGSLVRPQIIFQMGTAYDMSVARAKDLAIAIEYFHTASLLFDDLPCMDNADRRRGAPCVHVAFGEAGAVLTALALINRAYGLCWRAVSACPPDRQSQGLAYVEQCLGVAGLLNGQSLDLHYSSLPHDRETTQRIASGKTVSLIRLTLVLPALLGGASATEIRLLEGISMYWGLSYQIVDDLKDVRHSASETGKTVARDWLLDRPNIALAIGIPDAVARLDHLIRLGDKTLNRILISRPALSFLEDLRNQLHAEVTRVSAEACEATMRAQA